LLLGWRWRFSAALSLFLGLLLGAYFFSVGVRYDALVLIGLLFLLSRDWRPAAIGIFFGIAGQGISLLQESSVPPPLKEKKISTIRIEGPGSGGSVVLVGGRRFTSNLNLAEDQICLAEWELRAKETRANYEVFSSERRLYHRGQLFKLKIHRLFECSKSSRPTLQLAERLSTAERLTAGILWGRQDAIPREWWESFNLMGISHLIVVSGSHLALILLAFAFVSKNLLRFRLQSPRIHLFRFSCILFIGSVLSVWPAEIPLLRAIAAFVLRELLGRFFPAIYRYSSGDWVCLVGFIFGLVFPEQIFTKSFLFSFSAAWALSAPSSKYKEIAGWKVVLVSLFVILVGNLWFQGISFFAVVLNVAMIPFFSFVLIPLLIWRECFEWGREWIENFCVGFISFSHRSADFLRWVWTPESISKECALLFLGFGLLLLQNRSLSHAQKCGVLTLGLLMSLVIPAAPRAAPSQLKVLDVGQGDGLLLELGARRVLIDGGHSLDQIPKLLQSGTAKIDLWILSHFDRDHDELLLKSAHRFFVEELWVSDFRDQRFLDLKRYLGKARLRSAHHSSLTKVWDDFLIEGLLPTPSSLGGVENANSLCILLSQRRVDGIGLQAFRATSLFLGDLDARGEKRLIPFLKTRLRGQRLPVLKLAHHGSRFSSTEDLIAHLQPQIAIVSAGRQNTYGHPHPSVIDRLQRWNSKIMSTTAQGDLILNLDRALKLNRIEKSFLDRKISED